MKSVLLVSLIILIAVYFAAAYPTGNQLSFFSCFEPKHLPKCRTHLATESAFKVSGGAIECALCHSVVTALQELIKKNATDDCIASVLACLCTASAIEDKTICNYFIGEYEKETAYVAREGITNPDEVCPILVKDCGSPMYDSHRKWDLPLINDTKPPVEPFVYPPKGSPTLRVLHISDLHIDFFYKIGTEADCGGPSCCRTNTSATVKHPAGKWGTTDAKCDMPYWTIEAILEYIQTTEQFDYIMWTGDMPAHDIYNQTRDDQTYHIRNLTAVFERFFPGRIIYSAVGNHESAPMDSYPPRTVAPAMQNTWLYSALNTSWTQLLKDSSITSSIMHTGSYVKQAKKGLRIISLNTNYCSDVNFFQFLSSKDLDGGLMWLQQELQKAELAGDKVHIIGHYPPVGGYFYSYGWVFNKIVNRYESTISGMFFGHTHQDGYTMYYDTYYPSGRPTGVLFKTPSVTTWSAQFPSYRIYTVDGRTNGTFQVLDYDTKIMNMTEANAKPDAKIQFQHEYTLTEAYNITSGTPEEMNKVTQSLGTPEGLESFKKYLRFHWTSNPHSCNELCRKQALCKIKYARGYDPKNEAAGCYIPNI